MKRVVLVPQEVGFRMNALPLPAVPERWMSIERMSIGKLSVPLSACAALGMLTSAVFRPKSVVVRNWTFEVCTIFESSGSGEDPTGRSTTPSRAGVSVSTAVVGGSDVVDRAGNRHVQRDR